MQVPKGWEVKTLNDIAKISSGGTPSRKVNEYWNGDIPWVTTAEIKFNIITDTSEKITVAGINNSSAKLFPKNTLLMAMYGQGKTRGKIAKLGIAATTNQACAAINLNENYNINFYFHFLASKYKYIRSLANNGGQENLSAGIVKLIKVPIPPLEEQQKIAAILSTWDKAINITEKMIANSQEQKKALMQQLLMGKKRLLNSEGKPFSGDWEEYRFEEIVKDTQLGTTTRGLNQLPSKNMFLIKMGNLTWGGFNLNSIEEVCSKSIVPSLTLKYGDFLFNTRNTPELVGKSAVWSNSLIHATYDNNINKITFNDNILPFYMAYYLNHGEGKAKVQSLPAGSTSVAAIYWKDLKNIKVTLPLLVEQQKIAKVLTTADQEIKQLKQKLKHLKQEKKALMQQLLTGKRRVIIENQ